MLGRMLAAVALAGLSASACNGPSTSLPASFSLAPGETARVDTDVLVRARFEEVLSDSRCPTNVECVWAGDALVAFTLTVGADEQRIELSLADAAKRRASFHGFSVELTSVNPYPVGNQPIAPRDYRASIIISRE